MDAKSKLGFGGSQWAELGCSQWHIGCWKGSEMRAKFASGILVFCVLVNGPARGAQPVCAPESLRPILAFSHIDTDAFYFQLQGPWQATYLLQVSTNLHDWSTFSTNRSAPWPPWIGVPATYPQAFVRAVLEDSVYPLFDFAVRAGVGIRSNSVGISVDSYDSADPRYSTNGEYDRSKAKDGGDLALGRGSEGGHYLGNSKIKGKVYTGQNASVALGPNGVIGSTEWHLSERTGIQPGWIVDDLRASFMPEPVKVPFTGGAVPAPGVAAARAYDYVLGSGDYRLNTLSGAILIVGNARLSVSSNISLAGSDHILISSNASLQIFCGGAASFGTISNLADVTAFQFYGLASNYDVAFSGPTMKGLVYAPNAYCQMVAGGPETFDLYGACIVRELFCPKLRIHFDEQLKRFCRP
jgi:hypothetical protein